MFKFVSRAVVALLAVLFFVSAAHAADGKVLRVGLAKEPANLNPILIPGIYGEAVAGNIFDTLVSFKESSQTPAPLLAEKWTISEDGKVYTFFLRKGVKFHNGDELKASDVKFTLEATMDPANASPSKEFFAPVESVVAVDDYTVKISLKDPYAPFLLALGNPTSGIMPEKLVREVGMDKFDRHPVGTGPFAFAEWTPDERIVLVKNADYFVAEPNLDKVVFRPIPKPEVMAAELQSGGLDIGSELLPQDVTRLSEDASLTVKSIPGLSYDYVGFSAQTAPFSDLRFRKAVYKAVPFDGAIQGIYRGIGERAYSWIPPGTLGDDVEFMKSRAIGYDEKGAEALFAELKKDGVITDGMEFPIYSPQNPQRVKVATVIATQLMKYGIKARVESLEWGSLFPLLKEGKCGLYLMGWGSVPDPDRWTYKIFMPDSSMNFSKYDVAAVTEALKQGRVLVDADKRAARYNTALRKALGEDYIHIPLVFKSSTVAMSNKVEGFEPSPQKYVHLVTEKRNVDLK